MRKRIISTFIGSMITLTGCSSIVNGTTEQVNIHSSPSEAVIKLVSSNGAVIREANGSLSYELKRSNGYFKKANYSLEVSSPGYETQIINLETSLSGGWYLAGNILVGGLIGWFIVDPVTGGMWQIEAPEGMDINSLRVVLKDNAPKELLTSAIKVN